eukprot:11933183-Alexandrium_andersonii.AAC.1
MPEVPCGAIRGGGSPCGKSRGVGGRRPPERAGNCPKLFRTHRCTSGAGWTSQSRDRGVQ